MRRELVLHPVAGDERHALALHLADRYRSGGFAVRRADLDLGDVVEERVEPGAAEDADPDGVLPATRRQADSFVLEAADSLAD